MASAKTSLIGAVALGVALLCIVFQVRNVEKSADRAVEVESPVLQYIGELKPEKSAYLPGETIAFTVTWKLTVGTREPVPILVFSCLENQADGVTYGFPAVPHIIVGNKVQTRRVVRVIPPTTAPGKYRYMGWAESHTDRLRQSARFLSEPFEVLPSKTP